jgi:MoaA/NifB/PqqE/SkfB family radical SAM enzyme
LDRALDKFWRRFLPKPIPGSPGVHVKEATITLKRVLNMRRLYKDYASGALTVRGKPIKLVIEATNVCNLHCPGCFTGIGENGRVRSAISLDFFKQVLDELGGTAIEVEFYNWGEPFLNKQLISMVEEATRRGLATIISTNFSVPFDEEKAEALVKAGLTVLGLSVDGTTQENYEKYRRGGNLEQVLGNAQMMFDARKKLGSATPQMIWSFHVFEHNVDEAEEARRRAIQMGFDSCSVSKGYTYDHEWEDTRYGYWPNVYTPIRCPFPWFYAVIHNDGGVAACCGSFYHEDDLGRISVAKGQPGEKRFADIWNNDAFQHARRLYVDDIDTAQKPCDGLCDQCLQTDTFQSNLKHIASGQPAATFKPIYSPNDGHNYFYKRRPNRDTKKTLRPQREGRATKVAELQDS